MGSADLAKFVRVVPQRVVTVLQRVHRARFGEEVAGGLDVVVAVRDRHHVLLHQVVQGDRPPGLRAIIYIFPSRKPEKYSDGNNNISYFFHPHDIEIVHRDVLPGCRPPQSRRACFSDPDVHVHLTSFDGFRVWSMVIYISLLLTKKMIFWNLEVAHVGEGALLNHRDCVVEVSATLVFFPIIRISVKSFVF